MEKIKSNKKIIKAQSREEKWESKQRLIQEKKRIKLAKNEQKLIKQSKIDDKKNVLKKAKQKKSEESKKNKLKTQLESNYIAKRLISYNDNNYNQEILYTKDINIYEKANVNPTIDLSKKDKKNLYVDEKAIYKGDDVVKMINISKTFVGGKIIANQNVNFQVKYNEIHAICGENGAGKSTLMSILFGLYKQDSGEVYVNGKIAKFKNAADATKAGLGMVHQHFKLVQVYSLLDNIILGAETTKFGFLNKKASIKRIDKICDDYNLNIDLKIKTNIASVGTQQRAEIVKLLYRGAQILIFDEPTAVLSDDEIEGFLDILLELKKQGKTIILISHKLNEVKKVADRITVLRKGTSVGTYDVSQLTQEKIVELMVGNKMVINVNEQDFTDNSQSLFSIKNLTCKKISNTKLVAIKNLSLMVNPGEILGIAGIEGNGQSELALAIAGLHKIEYGLIVLKKNDVTINITHLSPKQRSNVGIAHVPEDRHKYGLILDETVAYNLISNQVNSALFNKLGFLRMKEIKLNAINLCSKFDIKGANRGKALARSLSGGNQQKIVVAREMNKFHDIIVLVQPTRGLDVKAANFIHDQIINEAKNGKAIILISYELDEIIKVCSKIAVMDQGKIVYQAYKKDINRQDIGKFLLRADVKKQQRKA